MNVLEYTDHFFSIEEKLDLFHDRVDGRLWWDVVRHDVYNHVFRGLFGVRVDAPPPPAFGPRLRALAERKRLQAQLWAQMRLERHDTIVFRAPRQRRNGQAWDAAVDRLAAVCPGRHLTIDTSPHYYHRRDRLVVDAGMTRPAALDRLVAAFDSGMSIRLDRAEIDALVMPRLSAFTQARADYLRLFGSVRPRLVLLSQNGIEKAMFSAASELGIPLIEVQHGLINRAHPAYSYSTRIDYCALDTFPSHFLTFSAYWSRSCHYPVAHCIAIGNDDFFVARTPVDFGRGEVLFVSADIYHEALAPWLKAAAEKLPTRSFKYKLHPNQRADFERIRAEFAAFANVEVVPGSVPARDLMARTACVVLIQSTVAHEAVQSGRRLCVIPDMNYQIHSDLFGVPGVTVTPTFDALAEAISSRVGGEQAPTFFDCFDEGQARELLQRLHDLRGPGSTETVPVACPR